MINLKEQIKLLMVSSFVLSPLWMPIIFILDKLEYITRSYYIVAVGYFFFCLIATLGVACE